MTGTKNRQKSILMICCLLAVSMLAGCGAKPTDESSNALTESNATISASELVVAGNEIAIGVDPTVYPAADYLLNMGAGEILFKADANGKARLLEINPRVWGSYPLARVAGSGMSFVWFALSYNNGNPKDPIDRVSASVHMGKKMRFFPTDLLAGIGYLRRGQIGRGLGAFSPFLCDGLWEWRDMRPAWRYYRALFTRSGKGKNDKKTDVDRK